MQEGGHLGHAYEVEMCSEANIGRNEHANGANPHVGKHGASMGKHGASMGQARASSGVIWASTAFVYFFLSGNSGKHLPQVAFL